MGSNVKGIKRIMMQILAAAIGLYLALVGLMYVFQRQLLYLPDSFTPPPQQSFVPEMKDVQVSTLDGLDLFAWAASPLKDGKPWVVFFHGNAGAIGSRGFKARAFLDAGYGVLLVEYRGYGGNPGTPSEAGLLNDARAAISYLAQQGVAGHDMVLYGESLGTGVAVAMAAEVAAQSHPVRAVILEAPYTTIPDVAAQQYPFIPVHLLMKDHYDSLSRIQDIHAPLFIVHGGNDWIVPQSLGRKLFAAARQPKEALWIEEGGHNDLFGPQMVQALLDFLAAHDPG